MVLHDRTWHFWLIYLFKLLQSISLQTFVLTLRVNILKLKNTKTKKKIYALRCHSLSTKASVSQCEVAIWNVKLSFRASLWYNSLLSSQMRRINFHIFRFVFLCQGDGKTEQASTCSFNETDALLCVTYASPGDPATVKKQNVNAEACDVACGSAAS